MVRAELYRLMIDGLGQSADEVVFEQQIVGQSVLLADASPRRGRIDALLGRTVFEIKSDLRRERDEAERQVTRYLEERKETTGHDYVGVATDGAEFQAYVLADGLTKLGPVFKTDPAAPADLVRWVGSVVALRDELTPDVETVRTELGRDSLLYAKAMSVLTALWDAHGDDPDVRLKRDLWARLLGQAYGEGEATGANTDDLFLRHTYLTIIAKAVATYAFFPREPLGDARALLSGVAFEQESITGAVESDFFDWVLHEDEEGEGGAALVTELAASVGRFRLIDAEADILKGLYESLIDPDTRHDLGEYYTPDWLAARVVRAAVAEPWTQRVVDPACGSGTFLFHAVKALVAAGRAAGADAEEIAARASRQVFGIEVHPVAVIFARATWLLALAETLNEGRPERLAVPVYLGDALQWNRRDLVGGGDLEVIVPAGADPMTASRTQLEFPAALAERPNLFDDALSLMTRLAERGEPQSALDG